MPKVSEVKLSADLKKGQIANLYYFYGKEHFSSNIYAEKLCKSVLGKSPSDFNFIRMDGKIDMDELSDNVEAMPMFSEKKLVLVRDLETDKLAADDTAKLTAILSDIPEYTVLLFLNVCAEINPKLAKAKKILDIIGKNGVICEFTYMTPSKIAQLISKRCERMKISVTKEAALYLAEITQNDLTLINKEMEKLTAYASDGKEITKETVDELCCKQVDVDVYALAGCIITSKRNKAFEIIDGLFYARVEPVIILSTLAGAFIDMYRARTAADNNINRQNVVTDFSYPGNRSFLVNKAFTAISGVSSVYLRKCINELYHADLQLKSTRHDHRTVLEQVIVKLILLKDKT